MEEMEKLSQTWSIYGLYYSIMGEVSIDINRCIIRRSGDKAQGMSFPDRIVRIEPLTLESSGQSSTSQRAHQALPLVSSAGHLPEHPSDHRYALPCTSFEGSKSIAKTVRNVMAAEASVPPNAALSTSMSISFHDHAQKGNHMYEAGIRRCFPGRKELSFDLIPLGYVRVVQITQIPKYYGEPSRLPGCKHRGIVTSNSATLYPPPCYNYVTAKPQGLARVCSEHLECSITYYLSRLSVTYDFHPKLPPQYHRVNHGQASNRISQPRGWCYWRRTGWLH